MRLVSAFLLALGPRAGLEIRAEGHETKLDTRELYNLKVGVWLGGGASQTDHAEGRVHENFFF